MVGNEGQQPLHERGEADQGTYYGWQYDQGQAGEEQLSPAIPQSPQIYQPPQPIQQPVQLQPLNTPPLPPPVQQDSPAFTPGRYQEPIPDMGTSLGYGQGMEYQ